VELSLVDATLDMIDAAIVDQVRLGELLDAHVAHGWEGFPDALPGLRESTLLRDDPERPHWGTVLFVLSPPRTLIGMGGYYGPPSPEGVVEIGYAVAPEFQGAGWATRAARMLTERAAQSPAVDAIDAHTLAESNASTGVLTKLGFERIGEDLDPDEGAVWHWRRQVDRANTYT
jgi:RimJ/RimL family protein N-acetyltransferase